MKRLSVLLLALTLGACGGLPSDKVKEAEGLTSQIKEAEAFNLKERTTFEKEIGSDSEIKAYAARDKWRDKFNVASSELARAQKLVATDLKAILDRNETKGADALAKEIARIQGIIKTARESVRYPHARVMFVKEAKVNESLWVRETARLHAETVREHVVVQPIVASAQTAFPKRSADIATRARIEAAIYERSQIAAELVSAQALARSSGSIPDFVILGDGFTAVKEANQAEKLARAKLEKDLKSLDESYSKILIDMRDEYEVCVTRTSWYEGEYPEYPTETPYDYPCVTVSDEAYDTADALDESETDFAYHSHGWTDWNTSLSTGYTNLNSAQVQELWDELKLNPRQGNWPSDDNSSSFDIRETKARYFHRYSYVSNGVRKDGEWEPVTEELFDKHFEHLGMALLEKPAGSFENEAITSASPAGMALVGDERAGSWQQTSSGGSTWIWFHPYSSYGGYYGPGWGGYGRSDWDAWNKSRRSNTTYWGGNAAGRRFGTYGSTTREGGFAGTDFAKRGGFAESSAGVRGAGPNGRSGGPASGK